MTALVTALLTDKRKVLLMDDLINQPKRDPQLMSCGSLLGLENIRQDGEQQCIKFSDENDLLLSA
jgi:hypothetical protein